jgi:hypothetical protein
MKIVSHTYKEYLSSNVSYFTPQFLFEIFFAPVSIWPVPIETYVETNVGLHLKCS